MKGLIVNKNVQFIHQMVSKIQIYKFWILFYENECCYLHLQSTVTNKVTKPLQKIVDSALVKLSDEHLDELVKKTKIKTKNC